MDALYIMYTLMLVVTSEMLSIPQPPAHKRIFITVVTNNEQSTLLNNHDATNPLSTTPSSEPQNILRPISVVINTAPPSSPTDTESIFTTQEPTSTPITSAQETSPTDIQVNVQNNNSQQTSSNNICPLPKSPTSSSPTSTQEITLLQPNTLIKQLANICWQNKKIIFCCTVATGYLALFSALRYQEHIVHNLSWAHWGIWTSLDELKQFPTDQLAQDLYVAIQHHYGNQNTPYGFLSPIMSFLKDIEREITHITRFCWIHTWLERVHLNILFPSKTLSRSRAEYMKDKLTFLKETLISWMHYDAEIARYRVTY